MPRFYSQHGEDSLLWQLFGDDYRDGYYVEVGALDGRALSNTLSFEEEGWTGLCIEAHDDFFDLLRKNRPASLCVHAAVSDRDEDSTTFYANHRGSLSTLDAEHEDFFRDTFGHYFGGFEEQQVRRARLNTILEEVKAPSRWEFLTVDTEGHDLQVIQGLDFERYKPRVVILEELNPTLGAQQTAHMLAQGYHDVGIVSCNRFFTRYRNDAERLAKLPISKDLIHLPHPLDEAQGAGK